MWILAGSVTSLPNRYPKSEILFRGGGTTPVLLLPFTLVPWRSNLVFAPLFSNHGAPTVCFSHFFFCQVSKQCTKAVNTANRILGLISRTHYTEFKSKDTVLQLYKSLVRPHLEYCIQHWNPYYRKDIELIENDRLTQEISLFGFLPWMAGLWRPFLPPRKKKRASRNIATMKDYRDCSWQHWKVEEYGVISLTCTKLWMDLKILTTGSTLTFLVQAWADMRWNFTRAGLILQLEEIVFLKE